MSIFRLIPFISFLVILPATGLCEQILEQKLSGDHETILGFSMWETRKEDIFQKLGETAPLKRTDTKHDPYRYCYIFEGQQPVKLVLDLGWYSSFKELTGFTIEMFTGGQNAPECRRLSSDIFPVKTDSGIYIGMERKTFIQAFPVRLNEDPSGSFSEGFTFYEMTKCVPLEGKEEFRQEGTFWYSWIKADFEDDNLIAYYFRAGGEPDRVVTHSCSEKLRLSWPALFRIN